MDKKNYSNLKKTENELKPMTETFNLLQASLFTDDPVCVTDWQAVFTEMKSQTVAALPGDWLKRHPFEGSQAWSAYCAAQQGQWVRVMHAQDELLSLLESNQIRSVIIKGASAAMYYPNPSLRSMGDIDILVRRCDHEKAAELLESNGYQLTYDKDHVGHHYNYKKDTIHIELHKRMADVHDDNEELLALFENGIDHREWRETEGFSFPVFSPCLNGLVPIFHINQHLREGIGLRQIIDWMMYVNALSPDTYDELLSMLKRTGMERLALTVTVMCRKYLGLQASLPGCEAVDPQLCDELMEFILEKGNFGKKAGFDGRTAAFSLSATERGGFFRRLQAGGLCRWKAAKKYKFLRPFAWIYQGFRITGIFINNKVGVNYLINQRRKGQEQRKLIESLGLSLDRTIELKP